MKNRVAAVCGLKNSGKTTLMEQLISALSARGYRTAVIKHDGHEFTCDIPGTDSDRFMQAGAFGSAVYSASQMFVRKTGFSGDAGELFSLFPEADIILVEGMKDSALPKIEVVREGIGIGPVSNPEGRFLIVTDLPAENFPGEETASFAETDRIMDLLLRHACGAEEFRR